MKNFFAESHSGVRFDWTRLIEISGELGRAWVEEWRQEQPAQLESWMQEALCMLRQRQVDAGCRLLDRVAANLPGPWVSPIASVLHHRYLAALAYAQYCLKEFDAAERSLTTAHEEIRKVIERNRYLLPLADRCSDLSLQRIRISRSKCHWNEMAERIELARRMLRDEVPLCTFSDGTLIGFATLLEFYETLSALTLEERQAIRSNFHVSFRLAQFDRLVRDLYVLPGFVIGYP